MASWVGRTAIVSLTSDEVAWPMSLHGLLPCSKLQSKFSLAAFRLVISPYQIGSGVGMLQHGTTFTGRKQSFTPVCMFCVHHRSS